MQQTLLGDTERTLMSIPDLPQRCAGTSVSWARSVALPVNSCFQSLWSRQQRCKMAAARHIYMETLNGSNSTGNREECCVCARCGYSGVHVHTDLLRWFGDWNVAFVAEMMPLCFAVCCLHRAKLTVGWAERLCFLNLFRSSHLFSQTDLQTLALMSSCHQNPTYAVRYISVHSSGRRDSFLKYRLLRLWSRTGCWGCLYGDLGNECCCSVGLGLEQHCTLLRWPWLCWKQFRRTISFVFHCISLKYSIAVPFHFLDTGAFPVSWKHSTQVECSCLHCSSVVTSE